MNNWRDIRKEVPDCSKLKSAIIRVKYIYYIASTPTWATFPSCLDHMINENLPSKPFSLSPHIGIGTIHIDPPKFNDDGEYLLSGGYRFSDLKGEYQMLTHWMYLDDPYDESEENVDGQLLMDYDGKVKEPTSVKILEFDKPNKMRRKYDSKNIASIINKDPRFKKENNMKFVKEKEIKIKVFDTSLFVHDDVYMCTHRDASYVTHTFVGTLKQVDPGSLVFFTTDPNLNVITISIDDASDWTIERMIEPMSEEELHFLQDLITKYTSGEFGVNDGSDKHITDSIMKKLGLINVEES